MEDWRVARAERRALKQELFKIRLFEENELKKAEIPKINARLKNLKATPEQIERAIQSLNIVKDMKLTKDQEALKKEFESKKDFTSWQDFPDRWEVGDPEKVKLMHVVTDDPSVKWADKRDYLKLMKSGLQDIVNKDSQELYDRYQYYKNVVSKTEKDMQKEKDPEQLKKLGERMKKAQVNIKNLKAEFEKVLPIEQPKDKKKEVEQVQEQVEQIKPGKEEEK